MPEIEMVETTRKGDKYRTYKPASVNPVFVELQDLEPSDPLTDGKPFDGLVAGTFTDMNGRKFEFTEDDLSELESNTRRSIEATRSESGKIVGIPIDARGHEAGDGAGWIVGVELEDGILRFTPRWTSIGLELIGEGIRRFFSATVDTLLNVVMGGTLTNWPATRNNKTGEIMLRPIELAHLSQPIYSAEFQDESLDDRLNQIRDAWWAQEPQTDGPQSWVAEGGVFEDHVIIDRAEGGFVRVPYQISDEGEVLFADESEWTPVKKAWTDLIKTIYGYIAGITAGEDFIGVGNEEPKNRKPDAGRSPGKKSEDKKMTDAIAIADLSAEDQKLIVGGVIAELGLDPKNFQENGDLGESMATLVDAAAERKAKSWTEAAERKAQIAELSDELTGGTEDHPVGLPIEAEELAEILAGLDDESREKIQGLLSRIQEKGLTEFEESGHSRRKQGGTELDPVMAAQLTSFLAENDQATVAEFFNLNEDILGEQADYNLTAFTKESNDG